MEKGVQVGLSDQGGFRGKSTQVITQMEFLCRFSHCFVYFEMFVSKEPVIVIGQNIWTEWLFSVWTPLCGGQLPASLNHNSHFWCSM